MNSKSISPRLAAAVMLLLAMSQLVAQERVVLADDSVLSVFMVMPRQVQPAPFPLVILMGGGPGNISISQDTARWLGSGFAQRGWAVAVPVSPDNRSFRGSENNRRVAALAEALQQRDAIQSGRVLLAGISNGGLSALEVARRDPDRYLGVVAVPALSNPDTDNSALQGFPVYLRIGGNDQLGWADRYQETVASLLAGGVDLDAGIIAGAPHMFAMDWSTLEPWLNEITATDRQ